MDTWNVYTTLPAGILLARGFTGHEHIDLFDLINMDGRVYDPVVGRFLSPDPIIQNPENLQSLNRYSYCLNNPLSLTDPSGYSWLSDNWRSLVAAAVGITVSVLTCGTATPLAAMLSGGLGGFAGGVTGALLSGANLGQAFTAGIVGGLIGAASGFLNFASGSVDATSKIGAMFERAAKHAFSDAWLNGITGGDMEHGFITGALSSMGNGVIDKNVNGFISKVACAAALGGSVEEIGGGKFANGAITGAYGMLFNDLMHKNEKDDPQSGNNTKSGGVPPTGDKFYSVDGSLLWNENIPGEENQVFVVRLKGYQTLEDIKKDYEGRPDLLDRRLRQLSKEYEFITPNINSNVLSVVKNPSIWKYVAMTLSVMGEGYSLGHRGIPINNNNSISNYWANDFGSAKFQKWW